MLNIIILTRKKEREGGREGGREGREGASKRASKQASKRAKKNGTWLPYTHLAVSHKAFNPMDREAYICLPLTAGSIYMHVIQRNA